jgi:glyoxylase-like metal-dependent hydrolase (beta-lactamase superfamily II)
MRTKIFFTTFLLFVGLIANAQIPPNTSDTKEQREKRRADAGNINTSIGNLSDAYDNYSGNTKLVKVTTDVYFLNGVEENMGVILTKKGVILIDTQNEEEMTQSLKTVNRLDKKLSINYLITTSNTIKNKKIISKLRKDGSLFLAQNYITKSKPGTKDFSLPNFKPDLGFNNQLVLNFETKKIEVISLNDVGNSAVYLTQKNVLFTGSIFSNKKYPEINAEKGKSYDDISNALSKLYSLTNENTKIVPGQGDLLIGPIELLSQNNTLTRLYKWMYSLIENGETLEEILANKSITKIQDAQGYGDGPITREIFITSVYNEIAKIILEKNNRKK